MTELDLYWHEEYLIALLGSVYFFAFAMNGVILKQADKYGRRKMILLGCITQLFWWIGLQFINSLLAKYTFMFISGLSAAKNIVVYIYSTEITPKKYQIYVGAFCLTVSPFIVLIPTSLYLMFGGK